VASEYRTELDLTSAFEAPKQCPGCHAYGLEPAFDGWQTVFRCPSCGGCWHIELGWISPADALRCAAWNDTPESERHVVESG
jgi:hypothetical protein